MLGRVGKVDTKDAKLSTKSVYPEIGQRPGGIVRVMKRQPVDSYGPLSGLLRFIFIYTPDLKKKLKQADMEITPLSFIQNSIFSAVYVSAALLLITGLFFYAYSVNMLYIIPLTPAYCIVMFFYFMLFPEVKRIQRAKRIDQELVFAGRHLLIEIKAGIPLFDAMAGITKDYGEVSIEFNKIVEKITLGAPSSLAMREVAEANPSSAFNRLVMQLVNSITSGSDVATSLESVLDQISKEQVVQLKEYGQKLSPLVMFFMIFGIIMPSLGVAFLVILLSFVGGGISVTGQVVLGIVLAMIIIMQFIFLSMVETSRPKFDLS